MKSPKPRLTTQAIEALLAELKHGPASDGANTGAKTGANTGAKTAEASVTLRRLMEVYCVVKAGGVQVQREAAQAHLAREGSKIKAEIAALQDRGADQPIASLRQELTDLEQTVNWRLGLLEDIHPDEEKAVAQHLKSLESELLRSLDAPHSNH